MELPELLKRAVEHIDNVGFCQDGTLYRYPTHAFTDLVVARMTSPCCLIGGMAYALGVAPWADTLDAFVSALSDTATVLNFKKNWQSVASWSDATDWHTLKQQVLAIAESLTPPPTAARRALDK